ncbi:Ig-like domain-containing protein [Listeria monocytogenes]
MKRKIKFIILVTVVFFQTVGMYPSNILAKETESNSEKKEIVIDSKLKENVEGIPKETLSEQEVETEKTIEAKPTSKVTPIEKLSTTIQTGETYESVFPDTNLAAAISLAATGSDDITQEVTQTDLNNVISLTAIDKGIIDLTGINLLSNLSRINFSKNKIKDLSALNGLTNLSTLNVYNNQITSLILNTDNGLPNLVSIDIRGNDLTKIDIQNHPNLTTIICDTGAKAEVTEVTLRNLPKLREVNSGGNPDDGDITFTYSPLLSSVTLENLPGLKSEVKLDNCAIEELTINNLPAIIYVGISFNKIPTLEGISNLPAITSLDASYNELTEINNLHSFSKLQSLTLNSNHISVLPENLKINHPLLNTLNVGGQKITLSERSISTDLVLDNTVENFGQMSTPTTISNKGTYQNGQITWFWQEIQGLDTVDYQFNEPIQASGIKGKFSGSVIQPIKEALPPVISAY